MQIQKPRHGYKIVKLTFGTYKIPEEWEIARFGDISKIKRGASPRPIGDSRYFGRGRGWIRIADVTRSYKYLTKTEDYLSEIGESKSVPVNEGDLIMSIAATVGKPIILKMKACIHDGFITFNNLSKSVDAEFLYYLLTLMENKFAHLGQQGTQSNINTELVSSATFPKPPLPEQQKIASILSKVDELIQKTDQVIEQTQRLKKGLTQRLLTKGIGHTKFKIVGFNSLLKYEIPVEWRIADVREVSSKLVVGFVGTCDPYYTDKDEIPMIRTTNVKEGYLDLSNLKYVTREFHERNKKSQLKNNDLIVARHGENGQACLVRDVKEANCLSVVIIRPDPNLWLPEFFELAFNSDIVRKQISRSTGGGVQTVVNTSEIGKARIFIPALSEQSRIVSIISAINERIHNLQLQLNNQRSVKNGLMQKLLTGKIRVKV